MPMRNVIHTTLLIALIALKMLCNAQTAVAGTVDYTYDHMNRLVRTVYDDATVEDYLYDLMGNRLSRHTVLSSSPANTPPNAPSSPTPWNNATDTIAFNVSLRWSGGDTNVGDAVIYDVYCDTLNPPGLYTRTTETSVDIAPLALQQTYYWKVIARDSRGAAVEGPLWQFTTVNTPPNAPAYSSPQINSTVVPDSVYLAWQAATDPDAGDTIVDYDIYFGTSPTPPLVAGNQTGLSYPLGTLLPATVYYWRIVARDNHGGTSNDSPTWSLTTLDHSATVLTDRTFSQDTTLTAADGPYSVTNNVTVATGATLTIEPGTTLKFANGAGLVVNGNLAAQGTTAQPIIFTSVTDDRYGGDTNGDGNTTIAAPGGWTGIQVTGSTASLTLNMRYCRVFFANNGLTVTRTSGNADVVIDQSEFRNNAADGININASGGSIVTLALDGSAMTHNGGRGLYGYAENTLIDGQVNSSTLSDNGGHGLHMYANSLGRCDLVVNGNTISTNSGHGLYVRGFANASIDLAVDGNSIGNNGNHGIFVDAQLRVTAVVDLRNNALSSNGERGVYVYTHSSNGYLAAVQIAGNTISDGTEGIYTDIDQGQLTVSDNHVSGGSSHGIYGTNSATPFEQLITLNTVTGNGAYGIYAQAVVPVQVLYNDVRDNDGSGLYVQGADGSHVHYNNLYDNLGPYALVNGNSASLDARFNYFGIILTTEMTTGANPKNISQIWDVNDDVSLGTVLYEPWLPTAQSLPSGPVSHIITPVDGAVLANTLVQVQGLAVSPAGMGTVALSTDGGTGWQPALGASIWSADVTLAGDGTYTLMSRATDAGTVVETPGAGVTVTVDTSLPTTSGTLNEDETWSGTVTVTGDVTVPAGLTLTLAPGTQVVFAANFDDSTGGLSGSQAELIIRGSLVADSTTFSSSVAGAVAGDWYGIRLLAQDNDASLTLTDCTVSYAQQGLTVAAANGHSAQVTLTNSTITQSVADGVNIDARSGSTVTLTVDGSAMTHNGGRGLYGYGEYANTLIDGHVNSSTLSDNGGHGLYVYAYSSCRFDLVVNGNTISTNSGHGLYIDGYGYVSIDLAVDGNSISNNGNHGVFVNAYHHVTTAVDLLNNVLSGNGERGLYVYTHYSDGYPAAVQIAGNTVSEGTEGIYTDIDQGQLSISDNRVSGVSGYGIYCTNNATPFEQLITLNTVTGNGAYGIYARAVVPVQVLYNDVRDNDGSGLYVQGADGSHVHYNNLYDNLGPYALENGNLAAVDARFNYWGAIIANEMGSGGNPKNISRMYDSFDDTGRGTVLYEPWVVDPNDMDVDTIPDAWELTYFSDLTIINDTTDYDGDGLPDIDEYTYGTDPLQSDSDGDGMPDGWEVDHGLDPLTDDAVEDADTDGYSNLREYLAATDPSNDQDQPVAWGDIDGDLDVDGSDLATLSTEMGRTACTAATPCVCDLDQDGDVDDFDLLFFSEDFGKIIF